MGAHGDQESMSRVELKVAGIGGQGALTAAQVLARAGLRAYQYVTWFPSYGTQKRGGDSNCTVILSQDRIHSPILSQPATLIVMHTSALDRFEETVAPGGLIVVDTSLVDRPVTRQDVTAHYLPASEIGVNLGSAQLANLALLGAYLKMTGAVTLEMADAALEEMFGKKPKLVAIDREALRRGWATVA